ncbi:MAG TPA: hypothetical protein DCE55_18740 [Planctomycetaceae bacterium]|nr:hypothetical protein [Planctomycetaceae bacterium]
MKVSETLVPQCELGCNLRTVVTLLDWRLRFQPADAEQCDACTTPLLLDLNGRRQLIIMGANQLDGYDLATGKQLWCLPGLTGGRTGPSPTAAGGCCMRSVGCVARSSVLRWVAEGSCLQTELSGSIDKTHRIRAVRLFTAGCCLR